MYLVRVSISDFLDRALSISDGDAHAAVEFAGLAVLIARTADAEAIQNMLFDQWGSLNDLTGRRVLFVSANGWPRTPHPADGVTLRGGPSGLVAPGLRAMPDATSYEWQREFHATEVVPSEIDEEEDGVVSESAPGEKSDLNAGITRTASELADFFGLSEREIPCLVVLSMWDQDVYVISLSRGFDLYDFFRRVVIHYDARGGGPTARLRELREAEKRMIDIRRSMSTTRRHLDQARSSLSREQVTWERHRDGAQGLLRWLAKHGPSRAHEARTIETLIETESALSDKHLAIIDELITYVRADPSLSSTRAGFDLCRRLDEVAQRLGGAMPRKATDTDASDVALEMGLRTPRPITAAELDEIMGTERSEPLSDREIAADLERTLASEEAEIELLAARRRQLLHEMRDPSVRTGFSDAIRDAAAELKLTETKDGGRWRQGWTRAFVRQADAEQRLRSTLK